MTEKETLTLWHEILNVFRTSPRGMPYSLRGIDTFERFCELLKEDGKQWLVWDYLTTDFITKHRDAFASFGVYANENRDEDCEDNITFCDAAKDFYFHGEARVSVNGECSICLFDYSLLICTDKARCVIEAYSNSTVQMAKGCNIHAYDCSKIDAKLCDIHAGDTAVLDTFKCDIWASGFARITAIDGDINLSDSATLTARDCHSIKASGRSTVKAEKCPDIKISDSAEVSCGFDCKVEAEGNVTIYAKDDSSIIAKDSVTVFANDESAVTASGTANIIAKDKSVVNACGRSFVRAYDCSAIDAHENATVVAFDYEGSCRICDNAIFIDKSSGNIQVPTLLRYSLGTTSK